MNDKSIQMECNINIISGNGNINLNINAIKYLKHESIWMQWNSIYDINIDRAHTLDFDEVNYSSENKGNYSMKIKTTIQILI